MKEQSGDSPNNPIEINQPNTNFPELRTNSNRWKNVGQIIQYINLGLGVVIMGVVVGLCSGRIDPRGYNDACNIRGGEFLNQEHKNQYLEACHDFLYSTLDGRYVRVSILPNIPVLTPGPERPSPIPHSINNDIKLAQIASPNDNTGGDIMVDRENYPPCGDDLRYTHEFDLEDLRVWKHGGYLDLEHFWANQAGCVHAFDIVGRFNKVSIDTGDVTVDVDFDLDLSDPFPFGLSR